MKFYVRESRHPPAISPAIQLVYLPIIQTSRPHLHATTSEDRASICLLAQWKNYSFKKPGSRFALSSRFLAFISNTRYGFKSKHSNTCGTQAQNFVIPGEHPDTSYCLLFSRSLFVRFDSTQFMKKHNSIPSICPKAKQDILPINLMFDTMESCLVIIFT